MLKVIDVFNYLDSIIPFSTQEEWDNSGFLVGESDGAVTKILVCLDVTSSVIDEAKKLGCELIISHHPVIFGELDSITDNCLAYKCARKGISVISLHTCYDFADGGVSDILAETLGLTNIRKSASGLYTLGETDCKTVFELAEKAKAIFNTDISYSLPDKPIKTVSVCGGAGTGFLGEAANESDVFFTGESKHHAFINAAEDGLALICAGHYETEVIAVKPLADRLKNKFSDLEVFVANETSPIKHI